MKKCPLCKTEMYKVIYYGLPHNLCGNTDCNCLFGPFSFVTDHLPFNGVMLGYECGYFRALWAWLRN